MWFARQKVPGRAMPITATASQATKPEPIMVPTVIIAPPFRLAPTDCSGGEGDEKQRKQDNTGRHWQADQCSARHVHENAVYRDCPRRAASECLGEPASGRPCAEGWRVERGDIVGGAMITCFVPDRRKFRVSQPRSAKLVTSV